MVCARAEKSGECRRQYDEVYECVELPQTGAMRYVDVRALQRRALSVTEVVGTANANVHGYEWPHGDMSS